MNISRVEQMVCPLCARMNGRAHHDGCPWSFTSQPDYEAGWIAALDALVPPLCDEIRRLRDA